MFWISQDAMKKFILNLSFNKEKKAEVEQISSLDNVANQKRKSSHQYLTIEEAIAQNDEAEQRLAKAIEDLQMVNAELAKQIAVRIDFELELKQAKRDLFNIRADLSISQEKEKDALHIALHDSLTGLPNRLLLEQRLDHGLAQARRHGWKLAVLFIDLDKFKNINDSYGHDIGDKLLISVAKRLQTCVRGEDMVSRWGGDEFICLLLNIKHESDVISLANKMIEKISQEYNFDGTMVSICATIGIAICPMDGETAEVLFKKVDLAMYRSKGTHQRVMMFSESILEP
jgi:diguanylate cyclase (GGDEF)-like protein